MSYDVSTRSRFALVFVLAVAACGRSADGGPRGEGKGSMTQVSSGFVAAALTIDRDGMRTVIDWTGPDAIAVTVRLPGKPHEHTWKGSPAVAGDLQDRLSQLHVGMSGQGSGAALRLSKAGRTTATLTWSPSAQPSTLARVHGDLARIAHLAFVTARAYAERGAASKAADTLPAAIADLREGIRILGASYALPGAIDDTGTKLVLAEHEESRGKLDVAAALYGRVLESRLAQYAAGHLGAHP